MAALITIVIAVALLAAIVYLVLRYYPPLGSSDKGAAVRASANFSAAAGKFTNFLPTVMDTRLATSISTLVDFIKGNPRSKPAAPLAIEQWRPHSGDKRQAHVTWLGHSAMIVEVNGATLLLDPMLGKAPSPFPFFGNKRFSRKLPQELERLPMIDAVLFSHDHYDHLDYGTIQRIKDKVRHFFVPLGVKNHLVRWGVSADRVSEHDWWDELEYEGITLACTPARHFSGRSLTDRDSSLWCSWVIASGDTRIFFSGDSGYGPHFKEIGARYGPFDMTLMECGQYDERWATIHMMPEETVQAHLDVNGAVMIPIHWAAFVLSLHDWTDPVERAVAAAHKLGAAIATPKLGETVQVGAAQYPSEAWWK